MFQNMINNLVVKKLLYGKLLCAAISGGIIGTVITYPVTKVYLDKKRSKKDI